jgi:AcrR family transcriptional regulator
VNILQKSARGKAGTLKAPPVVPPEQVEAGFEICLPPRDRRRLREALIALAIERGGDSFTVVELSRRAGVSPEDFRRSFGTLEAAFTWIHLSYTAELKLAIATAFESQQAWADGMRGGAYAAARWFEENPDALRFGMVYSRGAGEQAEIAREETLDWAVDLIDTGRAELADPESKDRSAAIAAMGASYSSLSNAVMQRDGDLRPSQFVADWMYMAALPYLGREAALAELDRRDSDLERFGRGEI